MDAMSFPQCPVRARLEHIVNGHHDPVQLPNSPVQVSWRQFNRAMNDEPSPPQVLNVKSDFLVNYTRVPLDYSISNSDFDGVENCSLRVEEYHPGDQVNHHTHFQNHLLNDSPSSSPLMRWIPKPQASSPDSPSSPSSPRSAPFISVFPDSAPAAAALSSSASSPGWILMKKMGWTGTEGLGSRRKGRIEPVASMMTSLKPGSKLGLRTPKDFTGYSSISQEKTTIQYFRKESQIEENDHAPQHRDCDGECGDMEEISQQKPLTEPEHEESSICEVEAALTTISLNLHSK